MSDDQSIILDYYDKLASSYDQNRFDNSYGKFIHNREKQIFKRYLSPIQKENTLDLACGTGRFMYLADYGLDISPNMVTETHKKYPHANVQVADGSDIPYRDQHFSNAVSMHLMMHLDKTKMVSILDEVHRILKPKGKYIFDIPSKKRRQLVNYKAKSWHAGYQISIPELKDITTNKWNLIAYHGVAMLPLHRLPTFSRSILAPIDGLMSDSFLKEYASHMVIVLEKR